MNELKDIKIGPEDDSWIEWIDFDERNLDVFNMNSLILERKEFWDKLETECVKDCCGVDAYSFYPESIRKAKLNEGGIDQYITELIEMIKSSEKQVLSIKYMNQNIHKTTFLRLLDHIIRTK